MGRIVDLVVSEGTFCESFRSFRYIVKLDTESSSGRSAAKSFRSIIKSTRLK